MSTPSPSVPLPREGRTVHTLDARGVVRDWLVSPAWGSPCDDLDAVLEAQGSPWGPDGRWTLTNGPDVAPLKARLHARHPLLTDQELPAPVEGAAVSWTRSAGEDPSTGTWRREHTGWDGLVDWSRFCFTPEYRHALAATVLEVDQPEYRDLVLSCTGPFALWVGGRLVLEGDTFDYMVPTTHRVRVRLESGATAVHVATWQVAFRECRHVVALRVEGPPVRVVVPSPGADERRSRAAEQVLDSLAVGPWAAVDGTTRLAGPVGVRLGIRVDGGPETEVVLEGGEHVLDLSAARADDDGQAEGAASMLTTGESELTVRVPDDAVPVSRVFRVATLPAEHREHPVGDDPAVWRDEVLRHVADGPSVSARALARLALDPSAMIDAGDLATALRMVRDRYDCADFEAVGLVTLWHRAPATAWPEGTRDDVRSALTGFKYWIDQPGLDAMCYFTENHQMVWHTAELLVGELFAEENFGNAGWTGAEHAAHATPLVREWMSRKLVGGFSEFDSNAYLAIDALALVSLVEFASDPAVRDLAEAVLDKVLLTLASNSWRGVHGAAHGRSYTHTLRSARFEETAPIMWLLWGVGSLNDAVLPATALATAERYRVPELVRAVAQQPPEEWSGRQVYDGDYRLHHDLLARPYGSEVRVWRTPDGMLSSVQDYRSGLPGLQEHIWGATLGSEIQVFATHPAAASIGSSARPNAWAGQRVLPRAHQDRDTVLVLHRIPADDPVGSTHLWFPAPLFDEWRAEGSWLVGRAGNGVVAVAAAGGFRPQRTGDEAEQCWWPRGGGRAYVATVARVGTEGFNGFVASLGEPDFGSDPAEPSVVWTAPDGRTLALAWSGSFTVDGRADGVDTDGALESAPHLDNPAVRQDAGADRLVAEWAGKRLVVDYRVGRRLEPQGAHDGR